MISRSSLGRFSRTNFKRSRNFVAVSTLVAICWRRVAMIDYSWRLRGCPVSGRFSLLSAVPGARECIHPLANTQNMTRKIQVAPGLDERNYAIEVRPRMGTGDDDADRMEQVLPLCSGLVLDLVDDRLEALC